MGTKLKLEVAWPLPVQVCVALRRGSSSICIRDDTHARQENDGFTISGAFGEANLVPDVDRYRIERSGNSIQITGHGRRTFGHSEYNDIPPAYGSPPSNLDNGECYVHTLVIILESPHKKEYFQGRLNSPIAPAQGKTGQNLRQWLGSVICNTPHLYRCITSRTRAIISNPVRFQASLASVLRVHNSAVTKPVWKNIWKQEGIRNDFFIRLLHYRPNFIINACTSGLRDKVTDVLQERRHCIHSAALYEARAHPSCWERQAEYRNLNLIHT